MKAKLMRVVQMRALTRLWRPVLAAGVAALIASACNSPTRPSSDAMPTQPDISSIKQEEIARLLAEGRKSEELIALDRQLRAEGYRVDEASAIPLFDTRGDAILIPYIEPSSSSERIAMAVVRVNGTIRASAFRMRVENGTLKDTIIMTVSSSGVGANIPLGDLSASSKATAGCSPDDFWCCFWVCLAGPCAIGSAACLVVTGPAFWVCITAVCGSAAYSCAVGCP